MTGESLDIRQDQLEKLKQLFPETITEGKIDWEKLQATLGKENLEFRNERYVLNWAGKTDAFKVLQQSTTATLKPVPEESINFDATENVFIEGENLETLKVLQKAYYGKIKCIIIDPPYNTGNDSFIYPDCFKESKEDYQKRIGEKDEEGYLMKEGFFRKNSKDSGHYHSNWLSMMYPRLFLAKNLLRDDGVIFIHIDDYEIHNLRLLMNEIFGEENFICQLIWNKQHSQQQGLFKKYHEYVLLYAKNEMIHKNISGGDGIIDAGALKKISRGNPESDFEFPAGVTFEAKEGTILEGTFGDSEKVTVKEGKLICENGKTKEIVILAAGWTQKEQMIKYFRGEEVLDTKGQKVLEFYFSSTGKLKCKKERSKITPSTILPKYGMVSEQTAHIAELFDGKSVFDNPKPVEMIKDFISWFTNDDDIVLDFFGGSGTLGESVLVSESQIHFILVQLPELIDSTSESGKNALSFGFKTIADICKDRVARVIKKIEKGKTKNPDMFDNGEHDLGFKVFKLSSSSFKIWRGNEITEENLITQLDAFTNPVKEESKIENMLYELILKAGYLLTDKVEEKEKYYSVNEGELIISLEEMNQNLIDKIISAKPKKVITLDKLFTGNDQLKTNTVLQMRDTEIDFKTI